MMRCVHATAYLTVVLATAAAFAGCAADNGGSATSPMSIGSGFSGSDFGTDEDALAPTERLSGVPADPSTPLSELPNGSFIQTRSNLVFFFHRMSQFVSIDSATAYFQSKALQAYGPGSDGWDKKRIPSLDPSQRNCSFAFALARLKRVTNGINWRVFDSEKQILLRNRSHQKERTEFSAASNGSLLRRFGCDSSLTTGEIEREVFGGKIRFYVPKPGAQR